MLQDWAHETEASKQTNILRRPDGDALTCQGPRFKTLQCVRQGPTETRMKVQDRLLAAEKPYLGKRQDAGYGWLTLSSYEKAVRLEGRRVQRAELVEELRAVPNRAMLKG